MWPNPQFPPHFPADLVTLLKKSLMENFIFCAVWIGLKLIIAKMDPVKIVSQIIFNLINMGYEITQWRNSWRNIIECCFFLVQWFFHSEILKWYLYLCGGLTISIVFWKLALNFRALSRSNNYTFLNIYSVIFFRHLTSK